MKISVGLGLFVAVFGSAFTHAATPSGKSPDLNEFRVEGQSIRELHSEVVRAEDRFHALYNKLNRDSDFRVSCRQDSSTGTRLAKRSCSTRAEDMATAQQARDFLGAVDLNASLAATADAQTSAASTEVSAATTSVAALTAPSPAVTPSMPNAGAPHGNEVQESQTGYDKNMNELVDKYPELRKLLDDYVLARRRYEAARTR